MRPTKPFGANIVGFAGFLGFLFCGFVHIDPARAEDYKGFERGEALITPQELNAMIDAGDPKLIVIGVVKAGLTGSFTRGHIPGAVSAWRPDYMTKKGDSHPFDGMLADRDAFQEFVRSLGVDDDSKVVLYDERFDATHLWWAFFLYGKTDVRILDGGYEAWKAAGYDTEIGRGRKPGSTVGRFMARPRRPGWDWSMDKVRNSENNENVQLWDTREPDEWSGKRKRAGASRRGRIPWAKFLHWGEFKRPVNERTPTEFRTAEEIQAVIDQYDIDENKDQLFYCQSGVRTTTEIFALYLMGWDADKLHNYDGSWAEWSYYKENPAVTD